MNFFVVPNPYLYLWTQNNSPLCENLGKLNYYNYSWSFILNFVSMCANASSYRQRYNMYEYVLS